MIDTPMLKPLILLDIARDRPLNQSKIQNLGYRFKELDGEEGPEQGKVFKSRGNSAPKSL